MKNTFSFLLLSIVPLIAQAGGDVVAGKAQYGVCAACHGLNGEGNKMLNAPRLADQEDWYLIRQLVNYKKGIRGTHQGDVFGAQMAPMAMTLADDAAIANVAAYITTLKPPPSEATITGDVAKGKALYVTCAACHGQKGEGNKALNAPRLLDQQDWYMVRQMQNFRSGARGAHPDDTYGAQMAPMAKILADEQAIVDVISYIISLNEQ